MGEPEKPEGPHATFVIYKEELPMLLEREAMTPYEVAQIWEKKWGVDYATRLHFIEGEGPNERLMDRNVDILPLSPEKVKLHIKSPGILFSLAAALKQYGEMSADEVFAKRE